MNDISQQYLNGAKQQAIDMETRIAFYAENLPDLPVLPVDVNQGAFGNPWLTYPYSRNIIQRLSEWLTNNGWRLVYEKKEGDVRQKYETPRQNWTKKIENRTQYPYDAELILEFNDHVKGATCKRREIGQDTKMESIYEFTCDQE